MGLDIFFIEDIRNALLAANEASAATAAIAKSHDAHILDLVAEELRRELPKNTSQVLLNALHAAAIGNVDKLRHFRQGYKAALATVALAFGIAPQVITGGLPEELAGTVQIPARFAAVREP